ncbi:MAG TPA: ribosome-associated translation inhibitor RaiA [Streptosporangiaceae bacterium]|nr:ribosome-associated translation inhibitor RaiA [Streptosporangiaceae bacterium]
MEVIFKALHTDMQERFRQHATAKLAKIEKLDSKAIRIDVQVSAEHNPRQSGTRERVELTVVSRGPAIRAEAAAEDRFAALDVALGKLESRLRRVCDRRKGRHGAHAAVRLSDLPAADLASGAERPAIRLGAGGGLLASNDTAAVMAAMAAAADQADSAEQADPDAEDLVPVDMQGDGPLVVREKFHTATPMGIEQALFEMELVGHDFFLFRDAVSGVPSVVYRRRGYQYGVIRLMEEQAPAMAGEPGEPEPGRERAAEPGAAEAEPGGPESGRGLVNGQLRHAAAGRAGNQASATRV